MWNGQEDTERTTDWPKCEVTEGLSYTLVCPCCVTQNKDSHTSSPGFNPLYRFQAKIEIFIIVIYLLQPGRAFEVAAIACVSEEDERSHKMSRSHKPAPAIPHNAPICEFSLNFMIRKFEDHTVAILLFVVEVSLDNIARSAKQDSREVWAGHPLLWHICEFKQK